MSVRDIYDTMAYGSAPESAADAYAWLVDQGDRFGHFIDGTFTEPGEGFDSKNPATGEVLATLTQATAADVDAAVAAARKAQGKWERLGGPGRARYLYALARLLQKHARLFAVLETLDNGKPIREARDIDVPLAQRHIYFHAGLAQLLESERPGQQALGVCGQVIPWNFPLLMLSWKIAPALAAGNTVVLKPAEWTSLTALLFADICRQAGLPKGVVNIVTGDGSVGEMIVAHDGIDKVAFTGSTAVGRRIREVTAGQGKALTLELGGKSPYVVFDDADLDSAVEGLVDAIWFNQGQVCCAGSRLLVQEGVADRFHDKLRHRMANLRMGNPLDKCIDIGAMVDPVQRDRVAKMVDACTSGQTYRADIDTPQTGAFYPPTLITGLSPADPLMQEEIFGPVLVGTTFRTPAEAVQLANNTRYGLAASVWSENLNLALDVAPKLAAGVVWVNGTNMFDAAAPFGGVRESGFGREGGWEGLSAYLKPSGTSKKLKPIEPFPGNGDPDDGIDRTPKLYIGGKQARPDSGYARPVLAADGKHLGEVGEGNRKDIRNAVEAARAASGWGNATAHNRAQVLYYLGENLDYRKAEFAERIRSMTGASANAARREVDLSVERLFAFAGWADKFDGAVHNPPARMMAVAMVEPVGVLGIVAPLESALLGAISLLAPAIAMGNTAVLVPSAAYPLAVTDFYQVLETSDVPSGVVNIVTGEATSLAKTLAEHDGVDGIWFAGSLTDSTEIEKLSAGNVKQSWTTRGLAFDWADPALEGNYLLAKATQIKNVWVPYGA